MTQWDALYHIHHFIIVLVGAAVGHTDDGGEARGGDEEAGGDGGKGGEAVLFRPGERVREVQDGEV